MIFPECQTFSPCVQGDRVLYRFCNDPTSPNYRRTVKASVCRRCKTPVAEKHDKPKRLKRKDAPREKRPAILRRAMSYAEAVVEWTAAGRPKRSDEEVMRIFHDLCEPCKWFDPQNNICYECGCRVADGGFAIFNKIKMATQHCPRKKW